MVRLDLKEKGLLIDLYNTTQDAESGADHLIYRASHEHDLDTIDGLESDGYIRRDNDRYFISLTGLAEIDTPESNATLELAELLFSELKNHYRINPRIPLQVSELALRLNLEFHQVSTCLSYMIESSGWYAGHSTIFKLSQEANILPSEGVLKAPTFAFFVQQLQGWQDQRRTNRLTQAEAPHAYLINENPFEHKAERIGTPLPEWLSKLPAAQSDLLVEVYSAMTHNLRALASMGLRAVIDTACIDVVGDVGAFKKKLDALKTSGLISEFEFKFLTVAVEAGNASAHRGYVPDNEDLSTLLQVVEHLLQILYVLPVSTQQLAMNTPKRSAGLG